MRLLARRMRETGREYALRNLKDNIIHLELKPGSMVSENELVAQMGVSRTPCQGSADGAAESAAGGCLSSARQRRRPDRP